MKSNCRIFMPSNNFFIKYVLHIEISKDSSAKYYQNNEERLQKKACERYQSLTKEKK